MFFGGGGGFSCSDFPLHEGLEASNKRVLGNASDWTTTISFSVRALYTMLLRYEVKYTN
jgi:hypothetical protein